MMEQIYEILFEFKRYQTLKFVNGGRQLKDSWIQLLASWNLSGHR